MRNVALYFLSSVAAVCLVAGCAAKSGPAASPPAQISSAAPAPQRAPDMKAMLQAQIDGIKHNPRFTPAEKAFYIRQVTGQMGGGAKSESASHFVKPKSKPAKPPAH